MTTPDYRAQELQAVRGLRYGLANDGIPAWDRAEYATPEASKIEQFEDGSASFFASRVSAWHQLGITVPAEVTAAEAIKLAHLDWAVTKQPLQTVVTLDPEITDDGVTPGRNETVNVPGKFATVRVNPVNGNIDVLGTVGANYEIVQNHEAADEIQATLDVAGAHISTAGALDGGRRMFISALLPTELRVGGQDAVNMFLVAQNSHDGTSALTFDITPIRVVCTNTCRISRREAVGTVSMRHTKNVRDAMKAAREVLGITNKFVEEFKNIAEHLYDTPMDDTEFTDFIDQVFKPTVETKGKREGQETKGTVDRRSDLFGLWTSATQENIAGTQWAAYNTVVEYQDWAKPVQTGRLGDLARAERIARGGVDDAKTRALTLLTA